MIVGYWKHVNGSLARKDCNTDCTLKAFKEAMIASDKNQYT